MNHVLLSRYKTGCVCANHSDMIIKHIVFELNKFFTTLHLNKILTLTS